jgi:hypothetical protein
MAGWAGVAGAQVMERCGYHGDEALVAAQERAELVLSERDNRDSMVHPGVDSPATGAAGLARLDARDLDVHILAADLEHKPSAMNEGLVRLGLTPELSLDVRETSPFCSLGAWGTLCLCETWHALSFGRTDC